MEPLIQSTRAERQQRAEGEKVTVLSRLMFIIEKDNFYFGIYTIFVVKVSFLLIYTATLSTVK